MSQPQQIAPDIYRVDAVGVPFQVSTLLLRDGERWILVDTGLSFSPERLRRALDSLGDGPESLRAIFITHHHIDHVGGLNTVRRLAPEAEVWTTGHEAGIVSGEEPPDEPSNPLARRTFKLYRLPTAPVDRIVREGAVVGGMRVISTPGHTLGHASLIDDHSGTLFTADAFGRLAGLRVGGIKSFCTDPPLALRSARKLLDEDFKSVYFTHGKPLLAENGDPKTRLRSTVTDCDY